MQPLSCRSCGTCVLVKKNSAAHTQVQWTTDTDRCAELAQHPAADRASVLTCLQLRDSIETAVRRGELQVDAP
ncbi:hypothetical protein SAMN02982929_00918 [Saccharopolyspora kobensis]|uniref:Ferredoxin n=1 Tax=Saccharopolyspora kobensis TaxID=146035 RepID=A0A1H5VLR5_9PSEU|nr:hypothetical protein [Saccharopolyspora kobensis]SEF88150.1 hypothetical protein SAMN02982929_00918 [Saccharopolyspora kobensis]SFC59543.1 hypothetical protein SAMN05216506_1011152 [Saccharopolyspora kobensis]